MNMNMNKIRDRPKKKFHRLKISFIWFEIRTGCFQVFKIVHKSPWLRDINIKHFIDVIMVMKMVRKTRNN